MKQKVVIKVTCSGSKSRTKAFKIAVSVSGVEEAAFRGDDKSQIEVTGEVDAMKLTTLLRKNLGHAELISVSTVGGDQKKKEKGDDKEKNPSFHPPQVFPYAWPPATYVHGFHQPPADLQYYDNDPNCIIM